jgi:hypothetical protein
MRLLLLLLLLLWGPRGHLLLVVVSLQWTPVGAAPPTDHHLQ